ncbi:PAS domain-containing protein [Mycoplasmatota bacterium]|nr:PAS domain-containing protein [Mycoplasmatota bacterium]
MSLESRESIRFDKHLSYVIDHIKSGFIFFDKDGKILYFNHFFEMLFEEIKSSKDLNFIEILDLNKSILNHLVTQNKIEFTKTLDIRDNNVLFNISITKIKDNSDKVFGYVIINSLSSMEKQVDDLLIRELDTQTLINDALIGVFMVDKKHRIIRTNKTFCKLLGYKPYELHKTYSWTILNDYTKESIEKSFGHMENAINSVKTDFIKKNGELLNLKVMGKGGKIKGEPVMIYFVDTFPKG